MTVSAVVRNARIAKVRQKARAVFIVAYANWLGKVDLIAAKGRHLMCFSVVAGFSLMLL